MHSPEGREAPRGGADFLFGFWPWDLQWGQPTTQVREFILQGFSNFQEHQLTLFMALLFLYILTLADNAIIVTVIHIYHHLHTPVYFFSSVLSTSETFYFLVIIPCMLSRLVGLSQPMSLESYGSQFFFFLSFAITTCLLLAVMGYDRYVAI